MPTILWWGSNRGIAILLNESYPAYCRHLTECADSTLHNRFLFRGKWEMERTNIPVQFEDFPDWDNTPTDDPEWIFALNRHSNILELAQAFLLTNKPAYAQKADELLCHWLDNAVHTIEREQTSWRAIEAGIRCKNWLMLLQSGVLNEQTKQKLMASMQEHERYLLSKDNDFTVLSNWGVLQNHGLFLLGVYFSHEGTIRTALERLTTELRMQVLPDGVHWEQSPMYHCEVLSCYLDTILIARRNHIILPDGMESRVHGMAKALAMLCKPDGKIPCQSDSDDMDARDLLALSAYLFGDGQLKHWAGGKLSPENIWDLGEKAEQLFAPITVEKPDKMSFAMPESGNYVLRSTADESSNYLRFHCGCLGSGHGHADLLHFDYYAHGEDILIDPGRYTYVNNENRLFLKQPSSHNTILVDGKDFSVPVGSWGYGKIAYPVKGEFYAGETAGFISGAHLGYLSMPSGGIFVNRRMVWMPEGIIVICDTCYGNGVHTYDQYFHFHRKGRVTLNEKGATYSGNQAAAEIRFLSAQSISLKKMPVSPEYNVKEEGCCIRAQSLSSGFTSLIEVIASGKRQQRLDLSAKIIPVRLTGSHRLISPDQAEAVEINCNGLQRTILFCHEEVISEVGLIQAGEYKGYGKTIVFSPERPYGECLHW